MTEESKLTKPMVVSRVLWKNEEGYFRPPQGSTSAG